MFNNMWEVKEHKHYSKRVGREVPGVVSTGPMLIAVTTEMVILYKYVEMNEWRKQCMIKPIWQNRYMQSVHNMQYAYRLQNFLLVPFGFFVALCWCYACGFFLSFHVTEYNWDILSLANHGGPKRNTTLAEFDHFGSLKFAIVERMWWKFANTWVLKY